MANLTVIRDRVKDMQDRGEDWSLIEEYIDDLPVSEEAKHWLWLWAWSRVPDEDLRWSLVSNVFDGQRPEHLESLTVAG